MSLLYIYQHPDGRYFDFFDLTWNVNLDDCVAPYTRFNSLGTTFIQLRDATVIYVGTI